MIDNKSYILNYPQGNKYYLFEKNKQLLITHPFLLHLIGLYFDGFNLENYIKEKKFEADGVIYGQEEAIYYYQKFLFLKEHGYFEKNNENLISKFTPESIFKSFINTNQILFEVTERCNLNCYYCAYGNLYVQNPNRGQNDLKWETAKHFYDYIIPLWKKHNASYKRIVNVYFYGGEPLINFKLIEKIVTLFNSAKIKNITFKYGLTTNGILLEKHIEYLIANNFYITVSIDGNKENNSYRVFHNGESSFDLVINQLDKIYRNNPDYFNKNISFNSVLHNRNNPTETDDFLMDKYNKSTTLGELAKTGINENKSNEFNHIFKPFSYYLKPKEYIKIKDIGYTYSEGERRIITHYNKYFFTSFSSLKTISNNYRMQTGTCFPFSKKIYISTQGNIYPCEKISSENILGKIDNKGVNIDYSYIADFYNEKYAQIRNHCLKCSFKQICKTCIYTITLDKKGVPDCFHNEIELNLYLKEMIKHISENKKSYFKMFNKIYSII